jgi:hypothetical protein
MYFDLLVNLNRGLKKRVYKYRLFRTRRYVECAFGILSNKWRIFQWPLNVSPDFIVDIVKVCVFCTVLFAREMVIRLRSP